MGRDEWRVWLKAKMAERGMSQEDLAVESGLSQVMIHKYVTQGSVPNVISVNALAKALRVRPQEILDLFPVD